MGSSEIFERSLRTVLVIGGSAVGKSSFCRYLTEVLLARQAEVAFVDADIGQSNIGPPATVTLGYPVAPINFPTVPPAAYYFVGSTGPIRRFLPLVIGTATLAREARAAFVIIDTTGLVHESGRILKNYKIDACDRTSLLLSKDGMSLHPSGWQTGMFLASKLSLHAKRTARTTTKKSQCGGSRMRDIFFRAASLQLSLESILPLGFERNLLCGIADGTGRCLGLGIIERIDFASARSRLPRRSKAPRCGSSNSATRMSLRKVASSDSQVGVVAGV